MKLTQSEIKKIANLARLYLTKEEEKLYTEQLSVVFDYIEMLNEIETSEVAETFQVTNIVNRVRPDVVKNLSETERKQLIRQFTDREANLMRVPCVFKNP